MAKQVTFAGGHTLKGALLSPYIKDDGRRDTNIAPIVHRISISETMTRDSIRGSLGVIDMTGLLENYPLRGEERLKLRIADAVGVEREYDLFIYRIDNVEAVGNNKGMSYTIHFVSYQRFLSERYKVTRPFDLPIYGTVARLFTDYYLQGRPAKSGSFERKPGEVIESQEDKDILIEETDGSFRCVIPSYTPARAMQFLAQRAYSNISPSCSFRFFESADSFYFCTYEHLFRESVKNGRIFNFTHVEILERDNKKIKEQMNNLISLTNTKRFDTFDDIHSGAYRNKVLEIDLLRRRVNYDEEGFDYLKHRDNFFTPENGKEFNDRHSDAFAKDVFVEQNARQFLLIKDYTENVGGQLSGDQFIPQIVSNRVSYQENLNATTIEATGYGRMDITCGDIIDLGIPEINSGSSLSENKQLSGKYIVESLVRSFENEEYKNHYRLLKKDWNAKIDDRVNLALKTGIGGF